MTLSKEDIAYCDGAIELEQECSAGNRKGKPPTPEQLKARVKK